MAANKVFIVEDDAVIARAVAAHLTTWQMQVQCAGNFEKITEEVDEKWFCFVLEQILSNALKYTKQGSVKISAEESANGLKVLVKDTGIGIRSEDLPRIFEKGFTGYNGRMDKKASGLGLYLCKGVCEKLGHGISVASKEGEGTTVILTLQCEKVQQGDLVNM